VHLYNEFLARFTWFILIIALLSVNDAMPLSQQGYVPFKLKRETGQNSTILEMLNTISSTILQSFIVVRQNVAQPIRTETSRPKTVART